MSAALAREDAVPVEEAMSEGPSTIRPDVPLDVIVGRLRERSLSSALVTTLEGELVALLFLEDAEHALAPRGV